MHYRLLNSAVMPVEGAYSMSRIDAATFARLVREAHEAGALASYIGYEQTAAFVSQLAGVPIAVKREQTLLDDGDVLLIIRLRYRPDAPTKGAPVDVNDFEFFSAVFSRQ